MQPQCPSEEGRYNTATSLSTNYIKTHVGSIMSFEAPPNPRAVLAQCCLTSKLEWELVHPTWHDYKIAGTLSWILKNPRLKSFHLLLF